MKRKLFFLFSVLFVISSYLWIKEEVSPAWMKYQQAYYQQKLKAAEKEYQSAKTEKEKKELKKKIATLRSPKYEIKQILLKGEYSWAKQRNGDKVDRCITCHIDEGVLKASHNIVKEFPFDVYGCTVCHKGNGRALMEAEAHRGMYSHRRQMQQRLVSADKVFELWLELTELSPEETDPNLTPVWGNFRSHSVTGEKALYLGSQKCLRCHAGLTAPHAEQWKRTKFTSFDRVKQARDFIDGDEVYRKQCYKCHTTGYDAETGRYTEEGITCEACHGPGELFTYFMDIGKAQEGQKIARVNSPYNVCFECHISRHHEMRVKYYKERNLSDDWWFTRYSNLLIETDKIPPSHAWTK
ncbi:MAG: cytochrome c3 family protein [Candidatus Brocadiales bacterium]|nr:cytochrome c3 family protein [Candidatus Brocadiales bacterium]